MKHDDLGNRLCQRQGFLEGGVATADDSDDAIAQEWSVTARAVAHASSSQPLLSGNTELAQPRARCQDERAGKEVAAARRDPPALAIGLDGLGFQHCEVGSGRSSLLLQEGAELVAGNPVGKARKALDRIDAQEEPSRRAAGQHERLAAQACAPPARGEPGDPTSRDHDLELVS